MAILFQAIEIVKTNYYYYVTIHSYETISPENSYSLAHSLGNIRVWKVGSTGSLSLGSTYSSLVVVVKHFISRLSVHLSA